MQFKDKFRTLKNMKLQDSIVYISFLAVLLLFYLLIGPRFVAVGNLRNIAIQSSVSCIAAAGMVLVISCGMIDLSIGATASLTSVVIAMILRETDNILLSLFCGFLIGALIGLINGLLTTYGQLPPFLVTLGMQGIVFGFAQWLTKMQAVPIYNSLYTSIFGLKQIFGLPILFIWSLAAFVIVGFIVKQTAFGNRILATGASENAAIFTGIHTKAVKCGVMVINGVFSTFSGVLYSGRTMAARHSFGEDLTFTVIASVILGGTLMRGGKANVFGALVGVLLLSMAENGLIVMNFSVSEQMIFKGLIMVLAMLMGTVTYSYKKSERGSEIQ